MKNPSSLAIPLQKKFSAPLCNCNCTCNQLRGKMNQHFIMLISIIEGLALTYYTSDASIPENLKQEGVFNRKQYFSMLFTTLRHMSNDLGEVSHV